MLLKLELCPDLWDTVVMDSYVPAPATTIAMICLAVANAET